MTQQPQRSEPTAAPMRSFWRAAVLALAVVGALGGCSSTSSGSARSSDPASQPQGASGVTVFGDIDVGVTKERTR